MNLMKARIVLPLLGLLCGVVSLPASTLIGNLTNYTSGDDSLLSEYFATTNTSTSSGKAIGFTMGPTDYNLDSVTLRIREATGAAPVVEIWTGTTTAITGTAALLTLTTPTGVSTTVFSAATFTAPSTLTLTAGTTYYMVLRETGTATQWSYATTTSNRTATGLPGVTVVNRLIGMGGATPSAWTLNSSSVNNWFEINVSAVPEPTAASALLFGSVVWLGSRLRRRVYAA